LFEIESGSGQPRKRCCAELDFAHGGGAVLFIWTPQRLRIAAYFVAAFVAMC
jgi:hypothetical protein